MTGDEEANVPSADGGAWLGADEQHREWGVRFRFRDGRVAVTSLSEERDFVESRAEWYAGIEDPEAPDGADDEE